MPKFISLQNQLINLDLVRRVTAAEGRTATYIHFEDDVQIYLQLPYAKVLLAIGAWEEEVEERQARILREALHNSRGRLEVERHDVPLA